MKKIVLYFFLLMIPSLLPAQSINGSIVDSQNVPVAYANVFALDENDSSFIQGCITKKDGSFSMKVPANRSYLLKISSVEFETVYKKVPVGNIGVVVLKDRNLQLTEVIIKGHRPIIRQEGNRVIFDVTQMPGIKALMVKDVLKFAPGVVMTQDRDIKVAGKTATVFVDGRQLSDDELTSFLNSLKASDIARIEISQSHGGEYDASIQGGVINIITKKNRHGFEGSAGFYAATPQSGFYNIVPSVNLFYGTSKWNLYGEYSYNQNKSRQYSETANDFLYNETRHSDIGNYWGYQKQHQFRIGTVFSFSARHTFGFEVNGITQMPTTASGLYDVTYELNNNILEGLSRQNYYSHSDFYNLAGSYNWNIDSNKSFLKVLVNYNNKTSKGDNELNTVYPDGMQHNVKEADITLGRAHNITSTIDFRKNFKNRWCLSSGWKSLETKRSSNYHADDLLTSGQSLSDWIYRENILGGYLGMSKETDRMYLNLSLRMENTIVKGHMEDQKNTTENYTNWFPYLYVSYTMPEDYKYSLSYTKDIYRPSFSLMNGYVNRLSDVLYDRGNPDLKAQLTDVFNFTVSHARHSASLIYQHEPNAITEYFEVENGITYHTNINFGTTSSVLLNYTYSGPVAKWWQTNVYISGNYTHIPQSYNRKVLWGGTVEFNNRMIWDKVGTLTIEAYYNSHSIIGNEYMKGYAAVDMAVEHSFFKKALTVQIGTDDLFNGNKMRAVNKVPTLNYNTYIKNQTRQIWCRFVYNFSTKAKTNRNRMNNANNVKYRL
jgi:hypothetical protein